MNWELYTDGACQPNPGIGGWAFILKNSEQEIIWKGHNAKSTNNRMELQAVLEGLKYFKTHWHKEGETLSLYSDSIYLIHGISKWCKNWCKNNWIKKDGKEVLNQDLWKEIFNISETINLTCVHVKGHSGHEMNERVDRLAVEAVENFRNSVANPTTML